MSTVPQPIKTIRSEKPWLFEPTGVETCPYCGHVWNAHAAYALRGIQACEADERPDTQVLLTVLSWPEVK